VKSFYKERVNMALTGDTRMGNSQDASNVIKSDLGERMAKQADHKKAERENQVMYNKDPQPVVVVKNKINESIKNDKVLSEEINKIKKIYSY
jgi:fructose-1,6-bisphosphatase/inositol monophosphatase family enzyme